MFYALLFAASAAPTWSPPPLPVCTDTALLVKYDFAYVAANKCELCGAVSQSFCEYDWPSNDVPSCSDFDTMRNAIYAYYGRTFDTQKWKDHFEKLTWYRPNPGYSDALLSPEALRNVALLKDIATKGTSCTRE